MVLAKYFGLACSAMLLACAQPLPAELPSAQTLLYFPMGLTVLPDGASAYVASTNFDQRYDAGWLTRIDLASLAARLAAGEDLTPALSRQQRVPSLGGDLMLTVDGSLGYLAHRGLGYVTKFDVVDAPSGQQLVCGEAGAGNGLEGYLGRSDCDAAHLLPVKALLAGELGLAHSKEKEQFDDPLGLASRGSSDAWLSFLSDHRVASIAGIGDATAAISLRAGPKGARYRGLTAMADGSLLACGSQFDPGGPDVGGALLSLFPAVEAGPRLDIYPTRQFVDGRAFDRLPASIERAVAGGNDGRLFLLGHGPEAILVLRPTPSAQSGIDDGTEQVATVAGPAGYELFEAYALPGSRLTDLVYLPRPSGDLLLAISLERDALFFFDVTGTRLQLAGRLRLATGRGPVRALPVTVGQASLLLVSTFFDHGLSVVDMSPARPSDFVATSMQDQTIVSQLARP